MKIFLAGLFVVFMILLRFLVIAAPIVLAGYFLLWILGLV